MIYYISSNISSSKYYFYLQLIQRTGHIYLNYCQKAKLGKIFVQITPAVNSIEGQIRKKTKSRTDSIAYVVCTRNFLFSGLTCSVQ